MNNPRSLRVAEQIRQELAALVQREMKDPRVYGVSFTAVEVTRDLEHAKVWFTSFTGDPESALRGLAHAAGFLRTELAKIMRMRTVPKLSFQYDASVERGARLSQLIDKAVEEDRRHSQDNPLDNPPRDDEAQG